MTKHLANRVVGHLCTFNDPEYLAHALAGFVNAVDKLYIIEGSWKSSQGYDNSGERSSAETLNIIDKFVDNERIFCISANQATEKEQRQIGLERAKEDGAHWHWFLDSDEVYTKDTIGIIHAALMNAPDDLFGLRLKSYNFINSFCRYYEGNYNRISRVTPDAYFIASNDVAWPRHPARSKKVLTMPWKFFHYNYVKRDPVQFYRKIHYHETEDPAFKDRVGHRYGAEGQLYTIPDDIKIYKFTGKHPGIMSNHPNFVRNIYNDEYIRYR